MKHLPAARNNFSPIYSPAHSINQSGKWWSVLRIFVLGLILWAPPIQVKAQEIPVSNLYTDFNGFWSSEDYRSPNNSHNVIGFTYGGRTFTTGVDDQKLSDRNISFIPMTFQGLPVKEIEITSGASRFAQFGSMADGSLLSTDHTKLPVNFPVRLNALLNDGINGLDISTGVTNMKALNGDKVKMEYPFSNIKGVDEINDGRPDILISQIAKPIATDKDQIWFEDDAGNIVGNIIEIDQTTLASLGTSRSDFFDPNTGVVTRDYVNSPRDIRLSAYEASEFGLTPDNYLNASQLVYQLGGKSDVGFIAFNMRLFELLVANDDAATTFEGTPVKIDVLANDRIPSRDVSVPISIEEKPKNGSAEVVDGQVVYLPEPDYIGTDTFEYQICSEFLNTCHSATVRVQVGGSDLKLEKTLKNPYVYIGQVAEFRVEVNNQGPFDALGTQVIDELPTGYEFLSVQASTGTFDSNTGSWYVGDLPAGKSAQLLLEATVLPTGNYTNTAEARSKMFDENLSDNKSSATPVAFPTITLTAQCNGGTYQSVMIDLKGIGPWNREHTQGWTVHYTINGAPRILYADEPKASLAIGTSGTFQLTRIEDSLGRRIEYAPTPETRIQVSTCKIMVNPTLPVKTNSSQDS